MIGSSRIRRPVACTVAYHLRNVFSKLNIASRHQLNQVMTDSSNAEPAPQDPVHRLPGYS